MRHVCMGSSTRWLTIPGTAAMPCPFAQLSLIKPIAKIALTQVFSTCRPSLRSRLRISPVIAHAMWLILRAAQKWQSDNKKTDSNALAVNDFDVTLSPHVALKQFIANFALLRWQLSDTLN